MYKVFDIIVCDRNGRFHWCYSHPVLNNHYVAKCGRILSTEPYSKHTVVMNWLAFLIDEAPDYATYISCDGCEFAFTMDNKKKKEKHIL